MTRYTIGEVARLSGVSVRTLHHYDAIDLVRPSSRSPAGYRLYGREDLDRLREVLYYRELGFGLDEIAELLHEPDCAVEDHLRRQHRMLRERIARHTQMLAAIEKELEARSMGMSLTPEEQFEVFGTDKVGGEWADEARERWGDTDAYRESQRRAATYTKQDWAELKDESDRALLAWRDALQARAPATGSLAMELAERHRQFISTHFYECSYSMHRGLAEMYLTDPRFIQMYDSVASGLAQYVHDAIVANADRAEASGEN
jgi:DNA-binding transcriptional MerR regulator